MGTDDQSRSGSAGPTQTSQGSEQSPGVAALLSLIGIFIPLAAGAGQLYNGDTTRGILVSVIQTVHAGIAGVLIVFTAGLGLFVFGPIFVVVGLYFVFDAYKGQNAPFHS